MAKNFKQQIAERNKQGGQQPAVPGVNENLAHREPTLAPVVTERAHSLLTDIARPELVASGQIVRVRLSEVYATEQVRPDEDFEEEVIEGMSDSYSEVGILTPPRAFPRDKDGYRIWLGETRVRAARRRGDEFIDLYIGEPPKNDKKRLLGQLIENLHQSGLKPLATAYSMLELKKDWGMSGEEIAKSLGKPTSYVSKHMRLCDAPTFITSLLKDKITADLDLVYTLCQIHDVSPEESQRLASVARNDKLTRTQAKSVLDTLKGRKQKDGVKTKKEPVLTENTPPNETRVNPGNELEEETEEIQAPSTRSPAENASSERSNIKQEAEKSQPKIMVNLGQEQGYILLKVPADSGMIWVQFPSGEKCVEAISLIVRGVKEA